MNGIKLSNGLEISLEILKRLKKRKKELKNYEILIGTFTNCRECGLTYMVSNKLDYTKSFTFCTYEHRNGDDIIINGREGYISSSGDLPYKGDKHDYLGSVGYEDYDKATDILIEKIKEKCV